MKINKAQFLISNTDITKCPDDGKPEYAFIGRSNVGKSSLINMLTNHKNLAKTSSKPGKTMLINHFMINDDWYLVDLPGYGFAKRSMKGRAEITKIIEDYILERKALTNLFVLIDSRVPPQLIDLEFIQWLGESNIPFSIIFTKADKMQRNKLDTNTNDFLEKLKEEWEELPPYFITSSEKKIGRDEVLNYIDEINKSLTE